MRAILPAALAAVLGMFASLTAFAADDAGLLRVLAVQPTDVSAYVHEVEGLQALLKKTGNPARIRVWKASFAGADTGAVVVSVEVANLAALAKLEETIKTNPELAAQMKKISGMREVVSDSLYDLISR